jgi:folate-dependent phosphoribosylglycinamide formyltransferase PurN
MATIKIPPPRIPVIDQRTGAMSQPWYAFFAQFLQGANDDINEAAVTAAALAVRVVTLEVEDGNLFIDHAMDVRPTAEIDELRKRIAELETELSMIISPLAAIEELRKRVADIETDISIGM